VLLSGEFVLFVLHIALDHFGIDLEYLSQGFAAFYGPMFIAPENIVYRCFSFVFSRFGLVVQIGVSDGLR